MVPVLHVAVRVAVAITASDAQSKYSPCVCVSAGITSNGPCFPPPLCSSGIGRPRKGHDNRWNVDTVLETSLLHRPCT